MSKTITVEDVLEVWADQGHLWPKNRLTNYFKTTKRLPMIHAITREDDELNLKRFMRRYHANNDKDDGLIHVSNEPIYTFISHKENVRLGLEEYKFLYLTCEVEGRTFAVNGYLDRLDRQGLTMRLDHEETVSLLKKVNPKLKFSNSERLTHEPPESAA